MNPRPKLWSRRRRHAFACFFVLHALSAEAQPDGGLSAKGAGWVMNRGDFWLRLLRTQFGHMSEETTQIYLRWLRSACGLTELASGWHRLLEGPGMTDNLVLWIAPRKATPMRPTSPSSRSAAARHGRKTTSWSGDYRGRPRFARKIYDLFFLTNPTEKSASSTRSAMRHFFRFLDESAATGETVECSTDVTDGHGPGVRTLARRRRKQLPHRQEHPQPNEGARWGPPPVLAHPPP